VKTGGGVFPEEPLAMHEQYFEGQMNNQAIHGFPQLVGMAFAATKVLVTAENASCSIRGRVPLAHPRVLIMHRVAHRGVRLVEPA
jgi:hypothetical protein